MRLVLDDERQRTLKKYRDAKRKAKLLFRRQADQGFDFILLFAFEIEHFFYLEILTLLDKFTGSHETKLTLINELLYECQRFYPTFQTRLTQYKVNLTKELSLKEDQPSSSSSSLTIQDDYM